MKGSKTMSTSEPRVPLAATINLPGSQRTLQVNHCKMPDCSNFGVPARTEKGKPGPSADRDLHYKVHSTAKGTIPAVRCKACLDLPPIKSNASIRAEVEPHKAVCWLTRHEAAGSPGNAEVSEAHHETLWPAVVDCYRPASILCGCDESAGKSWTARNVGAGSTTEPRIRVNRCEGGKERWRGSETSNLCKNLPLPMPRFTTASTTNAISTAALAESRQRPRHEVERAGPIRGLELDRLVRLDEGGDLLDCPNPFGLKCHDHLPMIPDTLTSGSLCVGQGSMCTEGLQIMYRLRKVERRPLTDGVRGFGTFEARGATARGSLPC